MNYLRVKTIKQPNGLFKTYWTNTIMRVQGAILVSNVPDDMFDRAIVAELAALQYLLEVQEVVGRNTAGNPTTELIVSSEVIKALAMEEYAGQNVTEHVPVEIKPFAEKKEDYTKRKLVKYAHFLQTRFRGCPITVNEEQFWDEEIEHSATIDASVASPETIMIHGLGKALISAHVVARFAERIKANAWHELLKYASSPSLIKIDKNNPQTRIKYGLLEKEEGDYYYHQTKHIMLVVGKTPIGECIVLTVYPYYCKAVASELANKRKSIKKT